MKSKKAMVLMAGVLAAGLSALQGAIPVSLKVSAGPGLALSGGDLKSWAAGREAYFGWLARQTGNTGTIDARPGLAKADVSFEAVAALTPRWSVALGVGWIGGGTWTSDATVAHAYGGDLGGDELDSRCTAAVSAVPVTLSGIYVLSLGGIDLRVTAGAGLYFGRCALETRERFSWPNAPDMAGFLYDRSLSLKTFPVRPGIHFGAGVDLPLGKKLRLTADAIYRAVSLGGLSGDVEWSESATWTGGGSSDKGTDVGQTLWLGSFAWQGGVYKDAVFASDPPSWLSGAAPLQPSLNGLVLRLGLKLVI